ncbi:unnamed protein product [Nippostrongylus brasiliensis]|uniref:AFP-like domain-containing protein n=1 Tax=Nippostrongylus brasiliensis TaxID=27835 RepID=A0A0N4XL12_NIPBR|nr:unnamed protein product [Nippostrongylus brasiliensis]
MPMTQEELYQDQLNRKVLIDWVRITGLEVQRRTNYDSILQDLAERILGYPKDLPRAFSWPTMAGETKTGPAIRARMSYDFWKYFMKQGRRRLFEYNRANNTEIRLMKEQTKPVQNLEKLGLYIRKTIRDAYQKSNLTGEDIVITKGKIKIGSSEPMRPTTAAVKLNICMKKWQGDPLESMLSVQEMDAIKKGQLVYGSMKLNGINIPTSEKEVSPMEESCNIHI